MTKTQNTALTPVEPDGNGLTVRGIYTDIGKLTSAFAYAAKHYNLLAPITKFDYIPKYHAVSLRALQFNIDPGESKGENRRRGGGHVYKTEDGGLAFTKNAYDMIAQAAGISWLSEKSGRVDDGSDPHYVHFVATGKMRDFDGSIREESRNRQTDLRQGSTSEKKMTAAQLPRAREFILEQTESKAKKRVIAALLAICTSYTPEQIAKLFVIPKLVWTGETDDPDVARLLAEKAFDNAHGHTRSLYGPSTGTPRALPAARVLGHESPPPVGSIPDEPEEAEIVPPGEPTDAQIEASRIAFNARQERERLERAGQTTIRGTGSDDEIPY